MKNFEEAFAYLECRVVGKMEAGHHTDYLGEVAAANLRPPADILTDLDPPMEHGADRPRLEPPPQRPTNTWTERGYQGEANVDDGIGARDVYGGIAGFPRVLSEEYGFTLIDLLVVGNAAVS